MVDYLNQTVKLNMQCESWSCKSWCIDIHDQTIIIIIIYYYHYYYWLRVQVTLYSEMDVE